jgi:hypothetical protein
MENILRTGKEITIEGKTYTIRRLSVIDVIKVASILGKVYKQSGGENIQEQSFSFLLLSALPTMEKDIVEFLASVINVTTEEFAQLPPESLIDIIEALAESEDLKRFFDKVKAVMAKMNIQV